MLATIIQKLFRSPVFPDDEDRSRRARSLNVLIWGVAWLLIGQAGAELFGHDVQVYSSAVLLVSGFLLVVIAQVLLRQRHIRTASWVIVLGFWGLDTLRVFLSGASGAVYTSLYLTLVVFAGLLLGSFPAFVMAAASSLVSLFALIRMSNAINSAQAAPWPISQWLIFVWGATLLIIVLGRELSRLRRMITERQAQIEERKNAEEALKESEEKYRSLFENMIEGFALHEIILDENGKPVDYRFLEINPAFERLTGLKAENIVGRRALEVLPDLEPNWIERYGQVALTGTPVSFENHTQELQRYYSVKAYCPKQGYFATIFEDITARKRSGALMQARLHLNEFANTHSLAELLQETLDELCKLSESTVGFFHFIEPDQHTITLQAWSTRTLEEFCKTNSKGHSYDVELAGVWVDCLKQKQPVIHNDYASLPNRKGMPEGHATLTREMVFPISREEKFVAIIGVGNKPQDYTQDDVTYAMQLADLAWDITERKRIEEQQFQQVEIERKHHAELAKLREISASMREAERSNSLLQVFTQEVQEFCGADLTSSILFKAPNELITSFAPDANINLGQEQTVAIREALLAASNGDTAAEMADFASSLVLPLQSSNTMHGAVLVASRAKKQIKPDEQNMLNAIADMAGTALHRIDILETLEERVQQRTHDLVVLYNLITIISENWRLQDLLELSLVLTLETVKAERGIIYLVDGKEKPDLKPVIQRGFADGFQIDFDTLPDDSLAQTVFTQHKPLALGNLTDNPDYPNINDLNSYAGVPILARGEVRGVFSLFATGKGVFGSDEMALLSSIADHLGIGIDNSILWEQSRENAALEERNRLARNLHDSVSQQLYSLTLMAGSTRKMLERDHDLNAIKNSVERLGDTAHQALKEMRLLLYELRPAVLDSEGLVNALRHRLTTVEERLGVKVELQAQDIPELPSDIEDTLYHIALEALNNIVKHSGSTTASISIKCDDRNIVMEIIDSGKGFVADQLHEGLGLRNMRERAHLLGGEVAITSQPGKGTQVTARLKMPTGMLMES